MKEKETYKKAREILERFSEGIDINITPPLTPSTTHNTTNVAFSANTPFINNQRNLNNTMQQSTLVHRNVKHLQQQSQLNMTKSSPNITNTSVLNTTTSTSSRVNNSGSQVLPNPNATIMSSASNMNQTISQSQQFQSQNRADGQTPNQAPIPSALGLAASAQARTLLPRPIVAPNRSFFDKLLDFVIGEGPNNR